MNASKEIEIKLEVRDPRALKRRLAEMGFRRVKARHFESNRLLEERYQAGASTISDLLDT